MVQVPISSRRPSQALALSPERLAIVLLLTLAGCTSTTQLPPTQQTTQAPTGKPRPSGCHFGGTGLFVTPDRNCTPGQWVDNGANVCRKGYNPRPPQSVTSPLKAQGLKEYGLPASAGATTESDHLFPVWLGGATVLRNLWPQPNWPAAQQPDPYSHNAKDVLEFALYRLVCQSHKMSVADARHVFEGDWVAAYHRYVAP